MTPLVQEELKQLLFTQKDRINDKGFYSLQSKHIYDKHENNQNEYSSKITRTFYIKVFVVLVFKTKASKTWEMSVIHLIP